MKFVILVVLSISSMAFAENTEFSTVVRCVNYSGAEMTVVKIERRVVDIYTPKARFEDRLVATTGMVDPGVSVGWLSGIVNSTVNDRATVYSGKDMSLSLTLDWSKMRDTDSTGGYVVGGSAKLSTTDDKGKTESLDLDCDYFDHM